MDIPFGSFIFYKNIPSFGSWLQRFWTYSIYSHLSAYVGHNEIGKQEFEADLLIRFHSFRQTENQDIIAFSDEVPYDVKLSVMKDVVRRFEGKTYGFISWFTIFLRFLFQRMGFKNTHKWNILWGWGVICSELVWHYLIGIANRMRINSIPFGLKWRDLAEKLDEYDPDIFVPQDFRNIIDQFPECFAWITEGSN